MASARPGIRCPARDAARMRRGPRVRRLIHIGTTLSTPGGAFSTEPAGNWSAGGLPLRCRPGPERQALLRVEELAERRQLAPQVVVFLALAPDLVAGVEHRGVVAPAEFGADSQQ